MSRKRHTPEFKVVAASEVHGEGCSIGAGDDGADQITATGGNMNHVVFDLGNQVVEAAQHAASERGYRPGRV